MINTNCCNTDRGALKQCFQEFRFIYVPGGVSPVWNITYRLNLTKRSSADHVVVTSITSASIKQTCHHNIYLKTNFLASDLNDRETKTYTSPHMTSGWLPIKSLRLLKSLINQNKHVEIQTHDHVKCSHGSLWNPPRWYLQQSDRRLPSTWRLLQQVRPEPASWWRWHTCPNLHKQVWYASFLL